MPSINPETQADCHASGTVRIAAWAANERTEIGLCGHCLNKSRAKLTEAGWIIVPFRSLSTTAGGGTESTGQHLALEAP